MKPLTKGLFQIPVKDSLNKEAASNFLVRINDKVVLIIKEELPEQKTKYGPKGYKDVV